MQDALGLDHEDRAGIFEANGSLFREYAPFAEALPIKRLKLAGTGMCEADGIALLHLIASVSYTHLTLPTILRV